jgi:transposase
VRIREEITEEVDYQPSRFIRRHYVRFVYADPGKQTALKMPALPARVIPQASVGVGLLVHLLVSKYVGHIPLKPPGADRLQGWNGAAAPEAVPVGGGSSATAANDL